MCLLVTPRAPQFFFVVGTLIFLLSARLPGALAIGESYRLTFLDIDGNQHSTADGHVTVIVLTTPADREKARTVGDRIPDRCLGNPDYRMITIVRFARQHTVVGQRVATALIRHRVNEEAKRLQGRYDAKKIARDARKDIFVTTDFDGSVSSQFEKAQGAPDFCVFVFGRNGELIAQWHGVPSAEQLASGLK
jgi:hypothetical protein